VYRYPGLECDLQLDKIHCFPELKPEPQLPERIRDQGIESCERAEYRR
jgi:hypothetical protein